MDQHGCGENDPNGPVFDPVHGVIHHFYQIHLAAAPGHGPDYGHFVSKDFIHWAPMPVAIWNGLDSSVWPPRKTPYDNEAIFTGSATLVPGAAPDGKSPGIVNVYPGLCNNKDWPQCTTGTLLAIAVAADYANDELLTNWSKPSFNPIVEGTQRDPSSAWQTSSGEWRLRTYNSMVYGAASAADFLNGKFYTIGKSDSFRQCECPSFYPLPASSPGFEDAYEAEAAAGTLPTHVHKTSCGGDWWQIGSYNDPEPKVLGIFNTTPGWEDVWTQRKIDQGHFYASKDNVYPTLMNGTRRINWGWATVPPQSTQTLPREVTFNSVARVLQQYPIEEIKSLRGPAAVSKSSVTVGPQSVDLDLNSGVVKMSEIVAVFSLPSTAATFGISIGKPQGPSPPTPPGDTPVGLRMNGTDMSGGDYSVKHYPTPHQDASVCEAACNADSKCQSWTWVERGEPAGSHDCCLKSKMPCPSSNPACTSGVKKATTLNCHGQGPSASSTACTVNYTPPVNTSATTYSVLVQCGSLQDTLTLLTNETTVEIRIFSDMTFLEAYFAQGRVAMTVVSTLDDESDIEMISTAPVTAQDVDVYPIKSIWVTPDAVRGQPRIYH